jgi:hypothetical protein
VNNEKQQIEMAGGACGAHLIQTPLC